jgi:hypothetical protein
MPNKPIFITIKLFSNSGSHMPDLRLQLSFLRFHALALADATPLTNFIQ